MATYIPHRNDIIFLDFEPTKGKEIGKYRPALVLSSREYQQKTGLLICCPISTSIRGHITEVAITNMDEPCVVAASIIQTLSWKERHAKKVTTAQPHVINEVLLRLLPLMGADDLFK
ncbi:MAG: type II toxin-antitoxin system PemK/MazF family toxin [Pseudomonadales bacterium]|jgi:mRNA interferase MazF|nr:type II toxin-antitoxin system PemK/MazF family toxin [Pseudomonadales bacterium]